MPPAEEPRRNTGAAAWNRLAAQDLRIGTLHATREHRVPSANFFRRFQLESRSFLARELLNEAYRLLSDVAMPFKSQRAKIERLQPPPGVSVENWMLQVFPTSPELRYFASFVLTAWVSCWIS